MTAYEVLQFGRQSIERPSSSHSSVGVSAQIILALNEAKRIRRQIPRKLLSFDTQMICNVFHHIINFVHIFRDGSFGHLSHLEGRQEGMSNSGTRCACVVYIFVHETLETRRAFIKVARCCFYRHTKAASGSAFDFASISMESFSEAIV